MSKVSKFNDGFALLITNGVSTMWCAYLFAGISLLSLKSTLAEKSTNADVQWVAQTFLQLVLLSIIMVGQKVQAKRTIELLDKVEKHHRVLGEYHKLVGEIHEHLHLGGE